MKTIQLLRTLPVKAQFYQEDKEISGWFAESFPHSYKSPLHTPTRQSTNSRPKARVRPRTCSASSSSNCRRPCQQQKDLAPQTHKRSINSIDDRKVRQSLKYSFFCFPTASCFKRGKKALLFDEDTLKTLNSPQPFRLAESGGPRRECSLGEGPVSRFVVTGMCPGRMRTLRRTRGLPREGAISTKPSLKSSLEQGPL